MQDETRPKRRHHISGRELAAQAEARVRHPLNPLSEIYLKRLGPQFGLSRIALYLARLPPGKESFLYHRHERAEEFLYILSGRGRAEIGEAVIEIGPGDAMGFPAPDGPPHHLSNPYDEDLVYLMGGEAPEIDVAHFPRAGKRMVFLQERIIAVSDEDCRELTYADWLAED